MDKEFSTRLLESKNTQNIPGIMKDNWAEENLSTKGVQIEKTPGKFWIPYHFKLNFFQAKFESSYDDLFYRPRLNWD